MYGLCSYCREWAWIIPGVSHMFCSKRCEKASREIARLNEQIRQLQQELADALALVHLS